MASQLLIHTAGQVLKWLRTAGLFVRRRFVLQSAPVGRLTWTSYGSDNGKKASMRALGPTLKAATMDACSPRFAGSYQLNQPPDPFQTRAFSPKTSLDGAQWPQPYNGRMPSVLFEDMKRYVGFNEADILALTQLKPLLLPHLPTVVDVFYDTLARHPLAMAVFDGDAGRFERLKESLLLWLKEIFGGLYDDNYFDRRCKIGRTHVRVNLPQHYMFTAMNVIRRSLCDAINRLNLPDSGDKLASLHKLLDLELAIMNETYREDLITRLHEVERARHQAELTKSEHLAAVGELAASLAHEIKNPLAGISGAIQIFGDELDEGHPHKEIIVESLRQIDRLDAAVKDLLIYARPKPPVSAPVAIVQLLQRALVLLREEPAFRGVRVEFEEADQELVIRVDENLIQQVLTNLLINAAHACENGGTVKCRVASSKPRMQVIIEDNGTGMSREALDRAFEPFFTTKAKGTGLGLAICKRIVESHGGTITLESELGRGTRVTIDLPDKP
jgi:signal transduction histidine kinase